MQADFKIKFDINDYKDIYPTLPQDKTEIINHNKLTLEECVWVKDESLQSETIDRTTLLREIKRLKEGVFIRIKNTILWLPPNYYHFLQYGNASGIVPEFRLKLLKYVYFKIQVRNNKFAIGTYVIKNRGDGMTTFEMSDCMWEVMDGNNYNGKIGIQSKTNLDAKNPCWYYLKEQYNGYPKWLKDTFYSDIYSADALEKEMKFVRPNTNGVKARNIYMTFFPSVYNAMDGHHNMFKCYLDEFNKWDLCKAFKTYLNYRKFIKSGSKRNGLFCIVSSPSDKNGLANDEAYKLWNISRIDELDENGCTKSGVFGYYSDPLDGINGEYDIYGDADPKKILERIMNERANVPKDDLLGEIRGYPLNEKEMFECGDNSLNYWDNVEGMQSRRIELLSTIYKDEITLEPKTIWGNLEWENGEKDTNVVFRMYDKNTYDEKYARFEFSQLPKDPPTLRNIFNPPILIESVLGVDSIKDRGKTKNASTASMGTGLVYKYSNFGDIDFAPTITSLYNCRPHREIFFEDMIMLAIFTRSKIQLESKDKEIQYYIQDRGYQNWLIPEIGQKASSGRFGDAPNGRGAEAFMNNGLMMINAATNIPLTTEKKCLLDTTWFVQVIDDLLSFNRENTQKSDITMTLIQALLGAAKLNKNTRKNNSSSTSNIVNYFLS